MPFIPHTPEEVAQMLRATGVSSLAELFDEIPGGIPKADLNGIPAGLSEMEVSRLLHERASAVSQPLNFLGAGAYEHYIPAAVWQIATRAEFYSAYTPYQAEASQGTLQVLYEYQSMMASLTGMDVSNASLYDGASALAEAILMAVRLAKGSRRVLMPSTVHPVYRKVVKAIVSSQDIEVVDLMYCTEQGTTLPESLVRLDRDVFAALVIPNPNFFGCLEEVDKLTDWAHARGGLAVAMVNPLSLALLKAPGQWGERGADMAVGEGQPLGVPLASGGPYFGFLACEQALVRQMPGRIAGRTVDLEGKPGFTLTLQAREQHIRRSKATSNICTNQGLAVTAATIYLAIMGPEGLRDAALGCHGNLRKLSAMLDAKGIKRRFTAPCFHEAVFGLNRSVRSVIETLLKQQILAGLDLAGDYPELDGSLLVCATETKTSQDIARYCEALSTIT